VGEEGIAGVGPAGVYAGGGGDLAKAEELPPADRSDHAWRGLAWTGGLFFFKSFTCIYHYKS